MKALKKTLCLVLVLVMAFGLLGVTASAAEITNYKDFKDADKITYTEAVDVMVNLGIIEGRETGYFDGDAIVNRAEAAKIISYMILGKEEADKLVATSDPFKDVPKDAWFAGYVAFCAKQGLVDGYGDGNFGPADKVTAYQFAKMLLSAIGYGEVGEFVGQFWYVNVYKLAVSKGIFTVPGVDYNAGATREQTVVYAFNALSKVPQVEYVPILGDYVYKDVLNIIASDDEQYEDSFDTLGWEYYGLLELTDGYIDWLPYDGRSLVEQPKIDPGMYYIPDYEQYGPMLRAAIPSYVVLDAPIPVDNDVRESGLWGHIWVTVDRDGDFEPVSGFCSDCTLKATTYDAAKYYGSATKFEDAADDFFCITMNGEVWADVWDGNFEDEGPTAYRGVKYDIYAYGKKTVVLGFWQDANIVTSKTFTGKDTAGVDTIRIDGLTMGYEPAALYHGYEAIKAGDVVLATWMDNDETFLDIAKSTSGVKSLYDITTDTVTLGGKAYQVSGQYCWTDDDECKDMLIGIDATVTPIVFFDQGGFIIHVDLEWLAPDIQIATGRFGLSVDTTIGGTASFQAELVDLEAEVAIEETEYLYGAPTFVYDLVGTYVPFIPAEYIGDFIDYAVGENLPYAFIPKVFVYTIDENENDALELYPVNDEPVARGATINAKVAQIAEDLYGTEDTIYIIRSVENGKVSYTKYVGYNNIPTAAVYDVVFDGKTALYVYAEEIYAPTAAEFLVLSTDPVQVIYPAAGGYYFAIRAFAEGEEVLIGVSEDVLDELEAGVIYVASGIGPDGVIRTAPEAQDLEEYEYIGKGVVLVGGEETHVAKGAVVYLYNEDNETVMATKDFEEALSNDDAMQKGEAYFTYSNGAIAEMYVGVHAVEADGGDNP
jgi:hypothetical protein